MRRLSLIGGILVLALAWGALPWELVRASFLMHMSVHMAVVAVAAPLLAIGLGPRARLTQSITRWAFAPLAASLAEMIVVWAWHAPALHAAAHRALGIYAVEQASFLVVGLLLWLTALADGGPAGRGQALAGVVALLLTSMHMTLLGALLGLAGRPLYDHAAGGSGVFALTPLEDQHLGAVVMLGVGGLVYLVGGLALIGRLLKDRAPDDETLAGGRPC